VEVLVDLVLLATGVVTVPFTTAVPVSEEALPVTDMLESERITLLVSKSAFESLLHAAKTAAIAKIINIFFIIFNFIAILNIACKQWVIR
jgi:hypothetical protein